MSADNYIFIDRKAKKVYHCTASCVCSHKKHCLDCQKGSVEGKGKSDSELMDIATKAEEDNYTEYGITMNLWCK